MSEDNKVFTYPEFTGRRRIYTDVEKITKENIFQVLEEAMLVHMENANNMITLMRYEKGIQPLVRKKTIRKDVDIRVQDNLANQITEFKLGYVWGQPITYVQRGNKDLSKSTDKQNNSQDDAISMLNELNDSEYAFSKDQELGRFVEINGIGYQFVDIKKVYDGLAPFDLATLNPLFTFCIYRNSALQEKIAGVTFRRTKDGTVYYTVFTPDTRYEIKDMREIINGNINDDLPQSEFSITLNNDNQIFNVDNPASEINFLESGQKINVLMGYKLDSGSVEWMQMHSLYVHEWSADDEQATIKAVDVLQFMSDEYHKGEYYTDGISLYDLAEQVFADAGITPDEYDIDTYLKKVKVHNPLPNVTHKEALQIIANAGRCVLDYDRYGRIRIHSLFIPECETSSNGTTYYSDVSSVDVQNEKDVFATYEKNGWKADGKSLFLKRVGVLNSGYVSAAISKDDGTFTQNPVITRTLEAKYKSYGLFIEFGNILPKKFIIRTYADNVLNDTLVISSGIVQEFEIRYDFKEYDKMEVEFTEMPSNSRVHVNYISIGSETAYKVEYDDLYSTPIGTQLDKVKNIKVTRYLYSKGNTLDELVSETFTYDGNNSVYYVSEPSYGYVVSIQNGKSGQSASIVSSGAYYVEIALSGVSVGAEVSISVRGYKYNISTAYTVQSVNNRGNDKEWNNPLISDLEHSKELAEWVGDYYSSGIEYELDYRGEPAIDCGDTIRQENKYDSSLQAVVEESQISYDAGALSGGLRTRRKGNVERAKNRLV